MNDISKILELLQKLMPCLETENDLGNRVIALKAAMALVEAQQAKMIYEESYRKAFSDASALNS